MTNIDPDDLARLALAIRAQRRRLSLTQSGVARASGIHRNYIGELERGKADPSYRTLLRLAAGLRIPLRELIDDAAPR